MKACERGTFFYLFLVFVYLFFLFFNSPKFHLTTLKNFNRCFKFQSIGSGFAPLNVNGCCRCSPVSFFIFWYESRNTHFRFSCRLLIVDIISPLWRRCHAPSTNQIDQMTRFGHGVFVMANSFHSSTQIEMFVSIYSLVLSKISC